jgi:glutaredoxin
MSWRRIVFLCCCLVLWTACRSKGNGKDDPSGTTPIANELGPLELKDDTPNLLLTWIDERGDFHVVTKPADVPEKARDAVRVVQTTRPDGTGKQFWVADLTKKNPDGTYLVKTMSRSEWDEKGASRRKTRLEALAPPSSTPAGSASAGPAPVASAPATKKVYAIVYGADWCKPCHDAARYLRQKGVVVAEKNVESSEAVQQEMDKKLERAKMSGASIPVIDIMGRLLVGFSPTALDRAVENAKNQKTL